MVLWYERLEIEMCKELFLALNATLEWFLNSSVYLNFLCVSSVLPSALFPSWFKFLLDTCFPPLNLICGSLGNQTANIVIVIMCETGINRFCVGALWRDRWPFSYVFASCNLFQLIRSLVYSLLSSQSFSNGSSQGFRSFQFCLNYSLSDHLCCVFCLRSRDR